MKAELTQIQHARSVKDFPDIDLAEDEYVVLSLRRSRVGILFIWTVIAFCVVAFSCAFIFLASEHNINNTLFNLNGTAMEYLRLAIFSLYAVFLIAGVIAQVVYDSNIMFVTNRRAIQKTRTSLFANSTNIIELRRIEDVSFHQTNILDHIFSIGTLRMSTVGDETTYTFRFLDTPRDEVKTITHLIHSIKRIKTSTTTS